MSDFTISQIIEALSEPFPSNEVEFKPGALNADKTKALALAYVDSRSYIQRLNLICPDWQDEYQVSLLPDRVVVLCKLTINGVTRTGDGECQLSAGEKAEENAITTASAQAFKRACVKFGLGAYLYALPQVWCDYDHAKRRITNPPRLPDWALCPSERMMRGVTAAAQREAGEKGFPPEQPAAPAAPSAPTEADPGDLIVHFGRNQGKKLAEIWASEEGRGWIRWAAGNDGKGKGFEPKDEQGKRLQRMAKAFLMLNAAYAG